MLNDLAINKEYVQTKTVHRGNLSNNRSLKLHRTQDAKEFLKYLCIEGDENVRLVRTSNSRFQIDRPGLLQS